MIKKLLDKKTEDQKKVSENRADVARALEVLFAKDYISRRVLYRENFLRGIFFGFGSLIGATIFVTFLIWFLALFDSVPIIGPIFNDAKTSIEETTK